MPNPRAATLVAMLVFVLAGCSVRLSDKTATPFEISDVTDGVSNERRSRTFHLEVVREPLVFEQTIRPTVTINGVGHALTRGAGNDWSVTVPEFDPEHPDRLPPGYEIFYEVRYQYLPLPIPIPFTATERLPSQGTIFVDLTPDVFTELDNPLTFTSTATRKQVRIYNLSNAPLRITVAEIQPVTGAFLGDGSGQFFAIEDPPQGARLPTLQPGESITYTLRFSGHDLACGTLVVETNHANFPMFPFPLLGKILSL